MLYVSNVHFYPSVTDLYRLSLEGNITIYLLYDCMYIDTIVTIVLSQFVKRGLVLCYVGIIVHLQIHPI